MRAFATFAAVTIFSLGVCAQQDDLDRLRPAADGPIKVMKFQNGELRDALTMIAGGCGLRVEFAPDVNPRQKISFVLADAKPVEAIRLVLDRAKVDAVVVDDTTLRVVPKKN